MMRVMPCSFGTAVGDAQRAARDGGEADEAADLEIVGADGEIGAVQAVDAVDLQSSWCRLPAMRAPMALSSAQRSCTCGSEAALRMTERPSASTAASSTFSVAVTLISSSRMSAPCRRPAVSR